ncbi:MAG TPA: transcriptional regulator [Thiotrichaceae bacterium]|nr:transcriptional regulator [Thiotrichaceae bacterium]
MRQTISIGDALFTKTQQKIMGLLFQKPDTTFYLNEIVRLAGIGKGTIKRELEKMTAAGLLTVKPIGNQKHYQANSSAPVYNELIAITRKTFGIADVIRQTLEPIKESIVFAFIYGSIAKATDTQKSDTDLMIIVGNDLAYADIMNLLMPAESELQRAINPSIYLLSDFNEKLQQGNSFLTRIVQQEKIIIMGSENVIRKIG